MGLVDKSIFEARGAEGCSDSDYDFVMTTCCQRVGVLDHELHDFYWNHESPSRSVRLVDSVDCPFCGAAIWDLQRIDDSTHVPDHWRWACEGQARQGSRRVRPLEEHLSELVGFCRRVAGPLPDFDSARFLDTSDPRVRYDRMWTVERAALLTANEFAPRFNRFLLTGYSWVNLSAYGVFEGLLVVGVELPHESTGVPAGLTSVNYSGPPLRPNGTPNWELHLAQVEWWLMDTLPDLNWARLTVFPDESAEVFDCDGSKLGFPSRAAARDFLSEDEFRPWDHFEASDFEECALSIDAVHPPVGATDAILLPRMFVRSS